ncbi:gliding motility protein GldM, partial [Elysia marginata]
MRSYKTEMLEILKEGGYGEDIKDIVSRIEQYFDVDTKIKDREGVAVPYLDYYFVGLPMIAQMTKLTQIQSDILNMVSEVFADLLSVRLSEIASFSNYTTLLELDRSVIFSGEVFKGSVVLGRKDDSTKPNEVKLKVGGRPLGKDEYEITEGKVKLNVRTKSTGDYKITGSLIFLEEGKTIEVPVNSSFSVIERPNTAVISAEKMNVVYRGVDNPISITIPGVPNNKVVATAPGLVRENGKYILRPGNGREVVIKSSGNIDGHIITSQKVFRIKDIPRPLGTISGQSDIVRFPKNNIKISTIGAKLEDFDFEMKLLVTSFKLSVPGLPSVT